MTWTSSDGVDMFIPHWDTPETRPQPSKPTKVLTISDLRSGWNVPPLPVAVRVVSPSDEPPVSRQHF